MGILSLCFLDKLYKIHLIFRFNPLILLKMHITCGMVFSIYQLSLELRVDILIPSLLSFKINVILPKKCADFYFAALRGLSTRAFQYFLPNHHTNLTLGAAPSIMLEMIR